MRTDDFPSSIEDISWFFFDALLEEFFHRYLPDKAKPLAIFAFCIWKICLFGNLANFGLQEVSDRENRFRELKR